MNTAMRMNTKAPGWSPMKCFEVDTVIKKDTGYEIDLIYDIFVEQIEDEAEDNTDISDQSTELPTTQSQWHTSRICKGGHNEQ